MTIQGTYGLCNFLEMPSLSNSFCKEHKVVDDGESQRSVGVGLVVVENMGTAKLANGDVVVARVEVL